MSVVILWDGIKNNYRYALNDAAPKQYILETPLKAFLSSKIKKVLINSGITGCFYGSNDEVHYESINDTTFESIMVTKDVNREIKPQSFRNRISSSGLTALLNDINDHPAAVPSIQDFRRAWSSCPPPQRPAAALVSFSTKRTQRERPRSVIN